MSELANDPRTLSMMGESTFRQKGEALYVQLKRNQVPVLLFKLLENQQIYGNAFLYSQAGSPFVYGQGQAQNSPLAGLLGGAGASNPFERMP